MALRFLLWSEARLCSQSEAIVGQIVKGRPGPKGGVIAYHWGPMISLGH